MTGHRLIKEYLPYCVLHHGCDSAELVKGRLTPGEDGRVRRTVETIKTNGARLIRIVTVDHYVQVRLWCPVHDYTGGTLPLWVRADGEPIDPRTLPERPPYTRPQLTLEAGE